MAVRVGCGGIRSTPKTCESTLWVLMKLTLAPFEAIALSDTFRYRKKRAIADAEAEAAYEEMMEQQEENP